MQTHSQAVLLICAPLPASHHSPISLLLVCVRGQNCMINTSLCPLLQNLDFFVGRARSGHLDVMEVIGRPARKVSWLGSSCLSWNTGTVTKRKLWGSSWMRDNFEDVHITDIHRQCTGKVSFIEDQKQRSSGACVIPHLSFHREVCFG
jgi:hypothetical protein